MLEWLQNPYVAIAVAVGAMFFGYFFGLFEGRGQGYKRRQAEETENGKKDTLEAPAVEERMQPAPPAFPPDQTSMLDVSKDHAGGLHLVLDGQHIEASVINPEQRKRIIAVLTQIRPWLESPSPTPQSVQPAPVQPAPAPEIRSGPPPRPIPPAAQTAAEPAPAPGSIVEQIDSILQTQLAGTPLIGKGIRLQESSEGGVIVWVGMSKFQGIEDVPDDQIRAVIRSAIATWEKKYTPGI